MHDPTTGEQPLKGLVSPAAQARMTLVEALSNLVFADITSLQDVKASCNWMWPAKVSEPLPWLQVCAFLQHSVVYHVFTLSKHVEIQ